MTKLQLCLVEDNNFQIGGRMLHRDLWIKLPRTPQSWYPWEQGNYFISLYGWIVWNMSEWDCLMNEWVSVVWTANFMRNFVIRNFPWTFLAWKLKLQVIPAGATWAFRTTPWRWTHGFTSSVVVWWLDHTGKNPIFMVSGWYLRHMNNVSVVSFI